MTEKDINIYNNSKIYTIRFKSDNDLIYVGSTTQPLHKRFYSHKSRLNTQKYNHLGLYKKMSELGIHDCYIELYENYNCNSIEELNKREGEIIRAIGTLNKEIAGRTKTEYDEEYRKNNQDKIKQYRNDNREKIKAQTKQYREENKDKLFQIYTCECGCILRWDGKSKHNKSQKHINLMKQKEGQI